MKALFNRTILAAVLCFTCLAFSDTKPTPLSSVKEGGYFQRNMFSTKILELTNGHFRYWLRSDMRTPWDPTYPLKGNYATNGGTVILLDTQVYETNWTFMSYLGQTTLWRPSALQEWHERGKIDPYGVLYPT